MTRAAEGMLPILPLAGAPGTLCSRAELPFNSSNSNATMVVGRHLGDEPSSPSREPFVHVSVSIPVSLLHAFPGEMGVPDPPAFGDWVLDLTVEFRGGWI